ncbi:MAG: DUF1854 domain-containing protein [Fimbriimonas sp.]|nr:DUF1854 domain-containing protein [Fimbriimonas sp.]
MIQKQTSADAYHLFHAPKDRLRLTIGEDRSYVTVKPTWAAPLSYPQRYLSLMNGKGEEITTIVDPEKELNAASYASVKAEIAKRYLTATISSIVSAKGEFGATYWHVESDRGERDFVTQSLQENAQWLSPTHLMLIDVDGNRFEIVDTHSLDQRSRLILETIL